jgi:CRP-like cAMP-binding protein
MMLEIGRPFRKLLLKLDNLIGLSESEMSLISDLPLAVRPFSGLEKDLLRSPCSDCLLVLDGFLYEFQYLQGQGRTISHLHVPGDVAGLQVVSRALKTRPPLAAFGGAVVALVPCRALLELFETSPRLRHGFWTLVLLENAILRERIISIGGRDALGRVAHLLCELLTRLRRVGLASDCSFAIPWTQADVADLTGISTVHANRVVRELRRLGIVDWSNKRVCILDWEALIRIADFSDDYLSFASGEGRASSAYLPKLEERMQPLPG